MDDGAAQNVGQTINTHILSTVYSERFKLRELKVSKTMG